MTKQFALIKFAALITCICATVVVLPGHATGLVPLAPAQIKVGYIRNLPTPSQFSQFKETFDFALKTEVNWIAFADGKAMNAALAAGELQIAYAQDHVPFVVGVSNGLELTMVGVAASYIDTGNCILRADSGISNATASQLNGPKVAVQRGSFTHYKLHRILLHLGVDPSTVELVSSADAAASTAALQSGEIDMACATGAVLNTLVAHGGPLLSGAEQQALGLKRFAVIAVSNDFIDRHAELVQSFMDVLEASNQQWRTNPGSMRAVIARAAGMDLGAANRVLDSFSFPLAAELQLDSWMNLEIAGHFKSVAEFLVAEGELVKSLDSYERFVTTRFLR